METLIRLRWLLLALGVAAALAALKPARQVTFDRTIESMFAPGDPLLEPYGLVKRVFGGNEIVMAVYQDEKLLDPGGEGIQELKKISEQLQRIEGVRDVLSLDRVGLGDDTAEFIVSPLGRPFRDLFEGYTHSSDGKIASMAVMLVPQDEAPIPREETIEALRQAMSQMPGGMITGEPVMLADGYRFVEEDGRALGLWSTVLLTLTIAVCFRSMRWVVIPIAVVQWTYLLTQATLAWSGLRLTMVSSMLQAIITVVGVATVMHIIVRFQEGRFGGERLGGGDPPTSHARTPRAALARAGLLLAAPIFWSILTDAAGFSSLRISNVGPVKDFGLMMTIGSLIVLPAVILLVPGMALWGRREHAGESARASKSETLFDVIAFSLLLWLQVEAYVADHGHAMTWPWRLGAAAAALALALAALAAGWRADPKPSWGDARLGRQLGSLVTLVERRPWTIGLFFLITSAAAIAGTSRLEVETDFTKNFRQGSPLVESYNFVESRLGGAGILDVIVPAPERLDWDFIERVLILEDRLRSEVVVALPGEAAEPALTKVLSLADVAPATGVDQSFRFLRQTRLTVSLNLVQRKLPIFYKALYASDPDSPDTHHFRIMLRARERQPSAQKRQLIEQVTRISQEEFPEAQVTGFFVLLTSLIDSLIADQWKAFGLATAAIWLMMLAALRSLRLATVALIPNALPILVVMGLMGWLGLKINMGAAMIAAVSMGLSIDSSVHYLTSYRRARKEGASRHDALSQAQHGAGRAMTFATLALVVGFSVLWTSDFVPTIYFGVLVCLAMAGSLSGNLIVLPLLVTLVERDAPPSPAADAL